MSKIDGIFVDLDGTLIDFTKKAIEIAGFVPDHEPHNKEKRKVFWAKIGAHVKRGGRFFAEMDMLHDGPKLWAYLLEVSVPKRICSATGHLKGAAEEKHELVTRHLGAEYAETAIFVRNGDDKALHAKPTHVLIDDRPKVLKPWIDAGGVGILHVSAADTIKQLKELGL